MDECLYERLRNSFPEHDCQTARDAGFAGRKNGELLKAAESAKFEVLLTADQGFEYEQNLRDRKIALIIFRAKSNRLTNRPAPTHSSLQSGSGHNQAWYLCQALGRRGCGACH